MKSTAKTVAPMILLITVIMTFETMNTSARAEQILIDDFKNGIRSGWKEKKFEGTTDYKPTIEDGIPCLKATAMGTASGMFYEIEYDPRQKPILSWKWKVDNIVKSGDARTKKGDDYPARIYVVFPAFFFWNTKAINYIWANKLPRGEAVPNKYTSNAMMVAVESGGADTGKWVEHRRNIYEDYRKYFGSEPSKVGAIALMSDTDTTGEKASACYGPIFIGTE